MAREEIEQLYVEEPNCFETDREEQWYKVGLKEGLAAADNSRWIPVEERLPKFDEQVLVYGLCPNGCRLFYVDCLIQDINDNGYPKWDDDTIIPTHWMEIQPPRKEDHDRQIP
jgi:hypothetical protein